LDVEAAATELGVHYQTVYRWVRAGRLPAVKIGSEYSIDPADVSRFAERRDGGAGIPGELAVGALVEALVGADEAAARSLVVDAREAGTAPQTICEALIVPAYQTIDDERIAGRLPVAEWLVAQRICESLVGLLAFPARGRPRRDVAVAGIEGPAQRLPGLLATVALRSDRWRVHDLGPNVPPRDILQFTVDRPVDLVVIAAPRRPSTAGEGAEAADAIRVPTPVLWYDPDTPLSELVAQARRTSGALSSR